jgi:hypothetical protein
MQLMLNDQESQALRNLLHDYLPTLRRELARTDLPAHEIRDELKRRVAVAERLVSELGNRAGATVTAAR